MLINGNATSLPLAGNSVHTCISSPPYWGLRDYGVSGQLGLEPTPEEYVANMVAVFREVRRVLHPTGTVWLNLGDSYATNRNDHVGGGFGDNTVNEHSTIAKRGKHCPTGLKMKDLCGIPWRVAFALQADGWYLRSDIIWFKTNPMPESVTDRPTKSHEYLFLLSKQKQYFYDADAVREGNKEYTRKKNIVINDNPRHANTLFNKDTTTTGRNRRTVWTIATRPYSGAHFATFPPDLVEPCIKAGTSERGCCPECGNQWERVTEKIPNKPRVRIPIGKGSAYYASPQGPQQQNEGGNDLG